MAERIYNVDDVRVIDTKGPWQTKSGGELSVLFALGYETLQKTMFDYDAEALASIPEDIRGLRSYVVSGLAKDSIGADEWHKIRWELAITTSGSALWTCVDTDGNTKEVTLNGSTAVLTPPGVLHTYQALESDTSILVICNTLFNPDDPLTHDTYSANELTT